MQRLFVLGSLTLAAIGWSQSAQTTEPPSSTQAFQASPGQAFYVDLDTAPGAFSQWRHDDLASLQGLKAVLRVPRIRKDGKWQPTFTIYLQNKDHQTLANDLGLQFVALGGQLPMKAQLTGHVDGKRMQEIPLPTSLSLNDELEVEVIWATPESVTFKIGKVETRTVRIGWVVDSVVISASTGQLKVDPVLFGNITR